MSIIDIGINASYFRGDTPADSVRKLSSAGFKSIEFTGLSLTELSKSDLDQLAVVFDSEGLNCTSINAVGDLVPVNLGNICSTQERERKNAISHLQKCVDCAAALKSKAVVCDIGSVTEDFEMISFPDQQDDVFAASISPLIDYAASCGISIVLMIVPARRWIASDRFPPDATRVVERHVWPWRVWPDEEYLLNSIGSRLNGKISWAFDTANAIVAGGSSNRTLCDAVTPYLEKGLKLAYLANHPGPYNKVWHRLLLHQHLYNGFYTAQDYESFMAILEDNKFDGKLIINIADKDQSEESLIRSLKCIARIGAG